MRNLKNSLRAVTEVSATRKVIAVGALSLVTAFGAAIPAGAAASNAPTQTARVSLASHVGDRSHPRSRTLPQGSYTGNDGTALEQHRCPGDVGRRSRTGTYAANTMSGLGGARRNTCDPSTGSAVSPLDGLKLAWCRRPRRRPARLQRAPTPVTVNASRRS